MAETVRWYEQVLGMRLRAIFPMHGISQAIFRLIILKATFRQIEHESFMYSVRLQSRTAL